MNRQGITTEFINPRPTHGPTVECTCDKRTSIVHRQYKLVPAELFLRLCTCTDVCKAAIMYDYVTCVQVILVVRCCKV